MYSRRDNMIVVSTLYIWWLLKVDTMAHMSYRPGNSLAVTGKLEMTVLFRGPEDFINIRIPETAQGKGDSRNHAS